MLNRSTDKDWERCGASDPYFGVITDEKFHKKNLSEESREAFFETGTKDVANILNKIWTHIDADFSPKRSLDFGCGVGRLLIPLAEISEHAVGIDVSESMLSEAKRNCEIRSIKNVSFVKGDDNLTSLTGKYDLIHSLIVFQHIPVKRGERIFSSLLSHLNPDGICVLHFTYIGNTQPHRRLITWLKSNVPFVRSLINLFKGKPMFGPIMQMNSYDLNRIFFMIQQSNVRCLFADFTDHVGHVGLVVYFKSPNQA